jgi:hypothetical protein
VTVDERICVYRRRDGVAAKCRFCTWRIVRFGLDGEHEVRLQAILDRADKEHPEADCTGLRKEQSP